MRAIYLIARREYLSYVATWGFWLSLASMPMFMALGFGLPILIESSQPTRYYALIDESGGALEAAIESQRSASRDARAEATREATAELLGDNPAIAAAIADAPEPAEKYIRVYPDVTDIETLRPYLLGEQTVETSDGPQPLFAAIYLRQAAGGAIDVEYWSTNLTDGELRSEIRRTLREYMQLNRLLESGVSPELVAAAGELTPTVRELNPERSAEAAEVTTAERLPIIVAIAVAFGLWIVIFSVVNMLLTAMIEEKGNKVLEMMLASSRHHEILTGKLLGVALVSTTLLLVWGGLAATVGLGLQQMPFAAELPLGEIMAAVLDPALVFPAIGYFIIGYLMYGAIFLAIGSLCETLQDAQTLMSPMMLIMMVPLFLVMVAADAPDSPIIVIASWVPLWTPFIMLARLPQDPALFDIIGTTVVMVATAAAVIWGAGVMFRMGALNQANQDTVKGWFRLGGKSKPG
ncbi:ABC transporter permease [Maricaulis salignorans]|uniref:ABC-2 type transport system permease protein n=1 Tax=Maricaulis salignorans TaxID=144026 RepID=A0A1G9QHM5_9PROT|nr:ABC transporter permease [Maricaulis salignorans]SDM10558.1 ABC-2 type transport system permease protein [Maricaulis salignorans]